MNTLKLKRVTFPLQSVVVRSILFLGLIGNVVNAAANLDQGLIAYYLFDGNAQDTSSSGNHGTAFGGVTYVAGKNGQAAHFDGKTGYIELKNTLDGTQGLTFAFWVNNEGVIVGQNNGAIISKYDWRIGRHFLINTYDKKLWAHFYKTANGNVYYGDTICCAELEINQWHHAVINVIKNDIQLYFDGVKVQQTSREFSTYNPDSNVKTYFGNIFYGGEGDNNHFHGALDEFRIYNRPLSDCEIEELYSGNAVCNLPPLSAILTSFNAETNSAGNGIFVKWETTEERDSSFFRLWRFIKVSDGKYINPTLLVEKLASGNPTIYSYEDWSVESGKIYTYRLSEVEVDGNEVFYLDDSAEATAQ
ncbi:hypothetical protein THII_3419 [Thioploca ingrica]|uniref:LamG-like jellyroll fold domain-containing protein n=1 Tax=Thioploca ingrica TaxID=40754 RepID=A0A090BVZ5_9GAMM|nr:hypothetical protein THII_3419 [Thioploca ingrica]